MNINYLVSEYSLSTPALNLYKHFRATTVQKSLKGCAYKHFHKSFFSKMNVREEGTREKRKLSTIKMFPIQTCETSQKIN